MVGIQGPQGSGGPGWGDQAGWPAPAPAGGSGGRAGGGDGLLIAIASFVAVVALVGGTVFVLGQRGDDASDGPTVDPVDQPDPTDPTTTSSTEPPADGSLGGPASYDRYVEVADDTGRITVELPADWDDKVTAGILLDAESDETTPGLQAATDLDDFIDTFNASGAEVVLYGDTTFDAVAAFYDESCADDEGERPTQTSGGLEGTFNLYSECTGPDGELSDGLIYQGLFEVGDGETVLYVNVNLQSDADLEALDTILSTVVAA